MVKLYLLLALILCILSVTKSFGMEFSKTTPSLEYIYNYYYDSEELKVQLDSTSIDSEKVRVSIDSSIIFSVNNPALRGPNKYALYFVNYIPYIGTLMSYSGDKSDLHAIGVETGAYQGRIISVSFQLSILPRIVSLETVEHIYDESVDVLDVNEVGPSTNTVNPKMAGTIVVKLSNVEYNISFNLELMVMGHTGYFPYFKSQWQFQAVKDSSNQFILDKIPPGKYNLLFRPDTDKISIENINNIGVQPRTNTHIVIYVSESQAKYEKK